jgi:hypothetical protein
VLLTVGITALAIGGRRVWRQSPPALMLAVVALAAGVATFRQQSFAALAALPALACALTFETRGWRRWTGLALATGAGLAGVVALIGTWRSYAFGASPLELAVPMRAVAFADSLGLEGQVLNTSWYGGYILWARGDRHPPLVDTRNRGSLEFRSQFRRAQTDPTAFDSMLSEWRFTHAIVQPLGENPDQLALWLARRSDWALIFTDDAGLLYVRRDAYPALATRFGYAMLTPDYTALGTLGARAARDTSLGRILGSELARARASSPWHARASLWLGLLRLAEGKPSEAAALLDEVEVLAPTMPGLALRQAMAHEAIGDLTQAESAYRRALREDADAPAARAALERLTRR